MDFHLERVIRTLKGHDSIMQCVTFSPDGKTLASADINGVVNLWNVIAAPTAPHFPAMSDVVLSPDGKRIVGNVRSEIGSPHRVIVWDVCQGTEVSTLKGTNGNQVSCLEFTSNGELLIGNVMVIDPTTGLRRQSEIKVWDSVTGMNKYTIEGRSEQAAFVAISPNGDRFARSVPASDGQPSVHRLFDVELWDVSSNTKTCTIQGGTLNTPYRLVFSPDGKRLAGHTAEDMIHGVLMVWDGFTGELLHRFPGHERFILGVAFSRDGTKLASAGIDGTVRLWNVSTGKLVHVLKQDRPVESVAFSTGGERVASGSSFGQITIWDTISATELLMLESEGHTDNVSSLGFIGSPHGDRLVSVGPVKNSVIIWDGTCLCPEGTSTGALTVHK